MKRKPFQNLGLEGWLHLGVFAIGVFYLLLTTWTIAHLPLFTVVGVDFRAFFASARIATTSGFAQVYNLLAQKETQHSMMAPYTSRVGEVNVIPTPLLPVFILPFLIFLPLGMLKGFILWTLLNTGVLIVYLLRLTSRKSRDYLLLGLALASFPVFLNLLLGQVNIWLMVCMGEFLLAWERGKGFYSGLWLGGLILKPQTLILLIPVLLLKKRWDILAGFISAALGIMGGSLALAGPEGISAWWGLLTYYIGNRPATDPAAMGNLRMLGILLSFLFPPHYAWGITGGLTVAVAFLAIWASVRREEMEGGSATFLLPLLAATSAVAWHSHLHMATILIPPLLRQVANGQIPRSLLALWALLPPFVYLLALAGIALLRTLGREPIPLPGFTYPALVLLGLHIYLTVRAVLRK